MTFLSPKHAAAEIVRAEAALAGRTFCWWSRYDSEQYRRDHTYVYSYHVQLYVSSQFVVRGTWSINPDGTITLAMEGGATLLRKYDIVANRVTEITGTLSGAAEGYLC